MLVLHYNIHNTESQHRTLPPRRQGQKGGKGRKKGKGKGGKQSHFACHLADLGLQPHDEPEEFQDDQGYWYTYDADGIQCYLSLEDYSDDEDWGQMSDHWNFSSQQAIPKEAEEGKDNESESDEFSDFAEFFDSAEFAGGGDATSSNRPAEPEAMTATGTEKSRTSV